MKIADYVSLIKAGYTKSEINAIVAAEKENEKNPEPEPEETPEAENGQEPEPEPEQIPIWAASLADSIKHLTETVQSMNFEKLEQPDEDINSTVDSALKNYLEGPKTRN